MSDDILYLSSAEVELALTVVDPVASVRDVMLLHTAGDVDLPAEASMYWNGPAGAAARTLLMPGRVGGRFQGVGAKMISSGYGNVAREVPRASGLTVLLDSDLGRVDCIMDGGRISSLRTACVTYLSLEALRRPGASTAALIGAGPIAGAHLEVMGARLEGLKRIVLMDLERARAERLAATWREALAKRGVELIVAASARQAVEQADMVVPATTVGEGYIEADWLAPGATIVNVSLDDLTRDAVLAVDRIYVDDWELVAGDDRRLLGRLARTGELAGPRAVCTGALRQVDGQLGALIGGAAAGRDAWYERILVNPFGMAIEDVALAIDVRDAADRLGLGTRLPR